MFHCAPSKVKPAVRIPFAFRADPIALDGFGLDPTARAVFVLILDNARSRGWRSKLGNATIGRILGRCPMTISRALGRLERAGLIRRELIAGGRVRTGIVVTWEGIGGERLAAQASVRREDLAGSARGADGVRREDLTNQSPLQSGKQTGGIPSQEEDPEEAARYAELGPKRYFRMCVEAGLKEARRTAAPQAPSPAKPATTSRPAAPPSGPRLDDPRREAARMVDQLAHGLATGRAGARRLSPNQLQRQIAEMRRRHGSGKAPPRA